MHKKVNLDCKCGHKEELHGPENGYIGGVLPVGCRKCYCLGYRR